MRARLLIGPSALALLLAACSSPSEVAIEQLIESDEGISASPSTAVRSLLSSTTQREADPLCSVAVTYPPACLCPLWMGVSSYLRLSKGAPFAVVLQYPAGQYGAILAFYEGWVAGQATDSLTETGSTNPRSDGWIGETGHATFSIALLESPDESGNAAVSVVLNWEE